MRNARFAGEVRVYALACSEHRDDVDVEQLLEVSHAEAIDRLVGRMDTLCVREEIIK